MKTATGISRIANWLVAGVLLFGVSAAATAQIKNTRHNLGSTNTVGTVNGVAANMTTSTAEICVFCHTPHGGDVSTVGAPLWNKNLNTGGAAFTTYTSSTMESVNANDGINGIGSVSLPCLSCHDGTQAMDNILNAPGSGGFSTGGGADGLAYVWTGGGVDALGKMTSGAALGKDLTNDHPIGIQYCGGSANYTSNANCNDTAFVTPKTAGGVFWVDSGTTGANVKEKSDMILFQRSFPANPNGGLVAGNYPSVECATCHDPHTANPTFLRVSNDGSAVCLTCHIK